jgi:hypothetical protein
MEIVIRDKNNEPAYAIRTAPNGLCFELFTWMPEHTGKGKLAEKRYKAGFVFQGRYPSTLSHALRMVGECILRESPDDFDAASTQEGMRNLAAQVQHMLDSFQAEIIDDTEQLQKAV